jgi:hypothetical protein
MRHAFFAPLRIALPTFLVLVVTIDTAEAQRMNRGDRGGRGESGWKFVANKYDANKDGSVSLTEYTRGETAFKELDANSDGVLNEEDWQGRSRRRTSGSAPRKGDAAPDFSLTKIKDADSTVTLSEFAGQKPVALLFGSCT